MEIEGQPILRMMHAGRDEWPRPRDLKDLTVRIDYRDAKAAHRQWVVSLRKARQGAASVMLDVLRHNDGIEISLRLDRVLSIECEGIASPPIDFLAKRYLIRIARTNGPTSDDVV